MFHVKHFLIICLILLSSCGYNYDPELPIYVNATTETELEIITDINNAVRWTVIEIGEGFIIEYDKDYHKKHGDLGECFYQEKVIYIEGDIGGEILKSVILHELGHALGHVEHLGDGIMNGHNLFDVDYEDGLEYLAGWINK